MTNIDPKVAKEMLEKIQEIHRDADRARATSARVVKDSVKFYDKRFNDALGEEPGPLDFEKVQRIARREGISIQDAANNILGERPTPDRAASIEYQLKKKDLESRGPAAYERGEAGETEAVRDEDTERMFREADHRAKRNRGDS